MHVVVLFGSPRKEGNTIQLVKTFSQTMQARGHDMRTIYLNDLNIRPCQGCLACMPKGVCRIDDDMKDVRKHMTDSDLIVYATPVYWFGPSGQLKLVMDRSFAFFDKDYNSRIAGKKAVTIMTCGDEDKETCGPSIEMFKRTLNLLGVSYVGSVEATGCEQEWVVRESFQEETRRLAGSIV
jgi:multimeric flavodoxin WrbA